MKFRELNNDTLSKEVKKQREVANKVKETMENANLGDCQEGFNLTKEILINNERLGICSLLQEVFADYCSGGFKWLGVAVTFFLGIIATLITDNDANVLDNGLVGCVIVLMIIGYVIDIAGKTFEKKVEKLTVRILNDMSYERYRFLVDSEQEDEEIIE